MDFLYDWVKNLAVFMIFISIIRNLLPKSHYEKYVKLFTGMLVILLVLQPLSGFLGVQDRIDTLFSLDLYSQEMDEMKADFVQAGSGYEDALLNEYEEQIKKQVTLLLQEEGVQVSQIDFYVCMEEGADEYGNISRMEIYLGEEEEKNSDKFPTIPTPEIELEKERAEQTENGFLSDYQRIDEEKLAEKICDYYNLERNQVEIYG